MSFLAGRLAGKEGAYFFQESKHAVGRLSQALKSSNSNLPTSTPSATIELQSSSNADVLPEVLRHSLPSRIFHHTPQTASSLDTASKWVLKSESKDGFLVSSQALNPLRDYVALPQVTFGPKRWQLPESGNLISASTANDLRRDRDPVAINPEKLKAAAEGLTRIGAAFAIATAIVFGGATLVFGMAFSKLQVQNADDIRTKGKELVEPKFEGIREQLVPLKAWVQNMTRKWHLEKQEDVKEKPLVKALSQMFTAKTSNR